MVASLIFLMARKTNIPLTRNIARDAYYITIDFLSVCIVKKYCNLVPLGTSVHFTQCGSQSESEDAMFDRLQCRPLT
jgi:hypothetical protein